MDSLECQISDQVNTIMTLDPMITIMWSAIMRIPCPGYKTDGDGLFGRIALEVWQSQLVHNVNSFTIRPANDPTRSFLDSDHVHKYSGVP
jgi:hypothetical protein